MPSATIEPNLAEEIRRVQAADGPHRRIPVLIELAESVQVSPGGQIDELERRVREHQTGVVEHLAKLGVDSGVRQATLANAISVALTPAEIEEIAARDDVRTIRLDREEYVTT